MAERTNNSESIGFEPVDASAYIPVVSKQEHIAVNIGNA